MTIDALALAAIRNEAEEQIRGCRIQKIIPTGPLSLVLEVYNPSLKRRVQFLMSADAQNARFHLLREKASQMPGDPNGFMLVLKRYLRYGIITTVEQIPFERIIIITVSKKFPVGKRPQFTAKGGMPGSDPDEDERDEDGDDEPGEPEGEELEIYESKIVCEMMGRYSNTLLLSEDNIIIDAIKRVASGRNRYRVILPHQPYVTPPPQDKQPFHLESPASFATLLDKLREQKPEATLWQTLVTTFSGVSPQLGREAAYRFATASELPPEGATLAQFKQWDGLYTELKDLLRPLSPFNFPPKPSSSIVRDSEGEIVAFAPYELRQFRQEGLEPEPIDSISQAVEEYYSQTESVGGQAQRKQEIANKIAEFRDKLQYRAASMQESLKRAESAELMKHKGEAIYAHLYEIEPDMKELVVDGLKVALDPDRTPSEVAQGYFREYDKARKALAGVPELLAETNLELDYLDEMLTQLELAESFDEVANIKAELAEAGYGKVESKGKVVKAKKRRLPQTPSFTSSDGFIIYIGKSAQHNEFVTFEIGDKVDLWLHARGMPGSHVIVKTAGRDVPEKTLLEAAALAAYYSKGQASTRVEVTYAPQKFVRKVKGPHPGLVTYLNDKSVSVKPRKLNKEQGVRSQKSE